MSVVVATLLQLNNGPNGAKLLMDKDSRTAIAITG